MLRIQPGNLSFPTYHPKGAGLPPLYGLSGLHLPRMEGHGAPRLHKERSCAGNPGHGAEAVRDAGVTTIRKLYDSPGDLAKRGTAGSSPGNTIRRDDPTSLCSPTGAKRELIYSSWELLRRSTSVG